MRDRFFVGIVAGILVLAFTLPILLGQNEAVSLEMENEGSTQEMIEEEFGRHIVDTETINLHGWINPGDFILLMGITTYLSEEGHVAMKVPCGPDGEQLLTLLTGVAPDVAPVKMEYVAPLSNPPLSCVYHADIGEGITDIALANTSEERVRFHGNAGYTATITIHGEKGGGHALLHMTTPVFYATLKTGNAVTAIPDDEQWSAGKSMTYISTTVDGRLALATSTGEDKVYAFDTRTDELITTVKVGETPKGIKISPDEKLAFVANEVSGSISVIDLPTWNVVKEIPVGEIPHNSIFSPDGKQAYVTIQGGDEVAVIDVESLEKIASIPLEKNPHNLDITPDGKYLFVANIGTKDVAVIDLASHEVMKKIEVSTGHHGIDVSPDGDRVYVSGIGSDIVNVIDVHTQELIKQITVGDGPHGLRTSPDNSLLYVGVTTTNEFVVIDTNSLEIIERIPTGNEPFWIAMPGNP